MLRWLEACAVLRRPHCVHDARKASGPSLSAWCWEGRQAGLRWCLHGLLVGTANSIFLLRHINGGPQCALHCILLCSALSQVRTCSSRLLLCRACSPLRRTASGAELSELSPDELESIHRGCNSLSDSIQPVKAQA